MAFAYFALVEAGLRGLRPTWEPWLFTSNAAGGMQHDGLRISLLRPDVNPETGPVSDASYYTCT